MKRDRSGFLYYAPLQGETSRSQLESNLRKSLSTVVYQRPDKETFVRSDAVLRALIDIGSRWRFIAQAGLLLPRNWRDSLYDWVANRRKKFFAKRPCAPPSPEENRRILP